MGSTYSKPHLSYGAQLKLLTSRGLAVTDRSLAIRHLQRIGYYHLSGYWYAFREMDDQGHRKDTFIPGSTFADVVDLYVFDKRLKMLVMDAIERIEIAMRVQIAYRLGAKDPFAQTRADLFDRWFTTINSRTNKSMFTFWSDKVDRSVQRALGSSEPFVRHFEQKYGFPLPIWVEAELWDFGDMSKLYAGMRFADKQVIATNLGVGDWKLLQSWLRAWTFIRNVAAHHARLWNRSLIGIPKLPDPGQIPGFELTLGNAQPTRLYPSLYALAFVMDSLCPASSWKQRLCDLVETFPPAPMISIAAVGFPEAWREHTIWNRQRESLSRDRE